MMNKIFAGIIMVSVVCGVLSGRSAQTGEAAFSGALAAVELMIAIVGAMCLWCGMMEILEKSGLSRIIAKFLLPVTKFLFPEVKEKSKAMEAITLNLTAGLIGLSNAATPLGIRAMEELEKINLRKKEASSAMIMLVVLNTASIQVIPSTILALRLSHGSVNPFEIVAPLLCASLCSTIFGVTLAKIVGMFHRRARG